MPVAATDLAPAGPNGGAVLIPVKAFTHAKGRLSEALDGPTRASLAQAMATRLVQVQRKATVAICCDDPDVAEWAASLGASTVWCPNTDLNGAVQRGFDEIRRAGYRHVAVAHSDLPLASSLDPLLGWNGVTLVPDRHRSGTNVIAMPTAIDFQFSYGTNSFGRHVSEAVRHRQGIQIVHDAELGWDIDNPEDLDAPMPSFLTEFLNRAGSELSGPAAR